MVEYLDQINNSCFKKKLLHQLKDLCSCRKRNGRIAYTPEEDLALLDFVNEYFTCYPIGGNALYKKAEKQKVRKKILTFLLFFVVSPLGNGVTSVAR